MRILKIPMQVISLVSGSDGENLPRLEQVHNVRIRLLPTKDGDEFQEISITPEHAVGTPSKCSDAATEIEKASERKTLVGFPC